MIECYVRGCHDGAEGEIDLLAGNNTLISILLCKLHYRKAWDAERVGWFGGSGID